MLAIEHEHAAGDGAAYRRHLRADAVVVVAGRALDLEYEALLSSAYAREESAWKLVLHQQTPLSGE